MHLLSDSPVLFPGFLNSLPFSQFMFISQKRVMLIVCCETSSGQSSQRQLKRSPEAMFLLSRNMAGPGTAHLSGTDTGLRRRHCTPFWNRHGTTSAVGILSVSKARLEVLCCVTVCRPACLMPAPLFSRFLGEKSTLQVFSPTSSS